jgi:hypothetical protein
VSTLRLSDRVGHMLNSHVVLSITLLHIRYVPSLFIDIDPTAHMPRAHPTLDDAFFSIDAFNRETEALEAQTRSSGALNEDEDEEDEDVDLFMEVEDIEDNEDEVNGK